LRMDLLEVAEFFHGHLGPFLVLGLKAGLCLTRKFGRNPLKSSATIMLPLRKPYTCFIDGFQLATGCTLGKMNINVVEWKDGIKVKYVLNEHVFHLTVRKSILDNVIRKLKYGEDMHSIASLLLNMRDDELFILEKHNNFRRVILD